MKLALLGADSQVLDLLQGLAEEGQHQVVWACDLGSLADDVWGIFPSIKISRHWESVLDGTIADAVIVARGANEDERADQLRKLVQTTVPALAMHPVVESMLIYYELEMIRRETRGVLVPYLPWRHHPAIIRAADIVDDREDSPIGALEQVVIERRLTDRSKQNVAGWFARDVDLARTIVGDFDRMSALGSPDRHTAYANLGIQMSGPFGVPVRWSVAPTDAGEDGQITLVGSHGKAMIAMPDDTAWRLELRGTETADQEWPDWNPAAVGMEVLADAMAGEPISPDWEDAARSVEMTETIDRCLEKGRTVPLHNESYTEAGTFKGTMTSLGCGLLLAGLGLSLFAAVVEQIANAVGWPAVAKWTGAWPYLLIGFLAIFLVLQFGLRLAAGSRDNDGTAD